MLLEGVTERVAVIDVAVAAVAGIVAVDEGMVAGTCVIVAGLGVCWA